MSAGLAATTNGMLDPLALALRYATAPYARGAAVRAVGIGPAVVGASPIPAYDFDAFQTRFGIQREDLTASYVLTLLVDQIADPSVLEIAYAADAGAGIVHLLIPSGTLAGTTFAIGPLPDDPYLVLQSVTEHPPPAVAAPSGPDKWALTALLGNVGRLLWVLSAERQALAATARDVKAQHHLLTARGASLDRIGDDLGVPRLLPAPYRLDLDADTVALYHLDDPIAPVLDAVHDHPGINVGGSRGTAGKFAGACTITLAGGVVIPDGSAFLIDPAVGFTVEMFADLSAPPGPQETIVFAVKRPRFDQSDSPGWSLALEPSAGGHDLAFTLTDVAGLVVRAVAAGVAVPAGWFHVAGVVDPVAKQAKVFLNGVEVGTSALGTLGIVETCADIGLGGDRNGAAHLVGAIDEVRFSATARLDFSSVLGPGAQPYALDGPTIALYHLDETDDTIDEDLGAHFATNRGANRGTPARFDAGARFLGDPIPHTRCGSERDFQQKLRTGQWDRTLGGPAVLAGPYARFGYRQGAISEVGLDGGSHPVLVNDDAAAGSTRGRVTTACYGFTPDDPVNPNNPSDPADTITKFQAAGRSVQEAIDYFGEWHGLGAAYFTAQYAAHGITTAYEPCSTADSTPTSILIPGSADFAFDAATSFTVEAFIMPDPVADDYPRAVLASRSSALREGEDNATAKEAGWALCLAPYRTIPNNLRWVLGDAAGGLVVVDADLNLADGAFHHIAGVVDRDLNAALLFVDGVERNRVDLASLAAAASNSDILMGNSPALNSPYAGLLDEVRISRGARRRFLPVLGESDDRYRQRLAIFQPFRLPSYPTIRRVAQALTLRAPGQSDVAKLLLSDDPLPAALLQFDVDETDAARSCASRWLRIIPEALAPGQSIADDGTTPADEPVTTARTPLSPDAPALVTMKDDPSLPNLIYTSPESRLMVLSTAQALERLAGRLLAIAPTARLNIRSAFVAAATPGVVTQDSVGRALTLTLDPASPGVDLGFLGALAFEIGFTYVEFVSKPGQAFLRVVATPGADLQLASSGPSVGGKPVAIVNQPITIAITRPAPKPIGGSSPALEWNILRYGPGDGELSQPGVDDTTRGFTGSALGEATIEVRYTLPDEVTVLVGSLRVRIAPMTLEGCDALGGDGRQGVAELDAAGVPDSDFRPDFLITSADARVDYAAAAPPPGSAPAANPHLMQLPLETALLRLADLAKLEPGGPRINVLSAFDPGASNLQSVGRALVVVPSAATLTAARLGALAFLAGFAYIERRRYPPSVYVAVSQADRFEIVPGPLERLWPNGRISGRGTLIDHENDAAGPPDVGFNPASLVAFNDARASFAAGVSNQMQSGAASAMSALLNAIQAEGAAGTLDVVAGFKAGDPTLLGVGRALLFRHPSVAADRLAGLSLRSGFGFVEHLSAASGGPVVYAAAYPASGAPPSVLDGSNPNYTDVYLGALSEFQIRPQMAVKGNLDWCVHAVCPAAGELTTAPPDPTDPLGVVDKVFQGTAPGATALMATFSFRDASRPYQFVVKPAAGAAPGAPPPRLTKDQYDDLLNFLDAYHPIGVECVTRGLRAFVHGFKRPPRWDRLPTAATFPHYRIQR